LLRESDKKQLRKLNALEEKRVPHVWAHPMPFIETTPALESFLTKSNVDLNLPVGMVAPPYHASALGNGALAERWRAPIVVGTGPNLAMEQHTRPGGAIPCIVVATRKSS
jgi:hypothetical protein